jgi:Domain of unknown function (DUF4430)
VSPAPARGTWRRAGAAQAALALAAVAAFALAVLAGCGVGEGDAPGGEATLTVTRDYGADELSEATAEPTASETVLRLLDRENEITTRYGGGFVQSIDGLSGGSEDGRRLDWFFYVNGTESSVGAAEVEVTGGDRIWWDYHDWTNVMRVPAVVGSWPSPFSTSGRAELRCHAEPQTCEEVSGRLEKLSEDGEGTDGPTVLVGPWAELRDEEEEARPLERGPQVSGVFARFERHSGGWDLVPLDETLAGRKRLGAEAGLVAALSDGVGEPTWLVTGTDEGGVAAAAESLDESVLENRFAVATAPNAEPIPLPVP